MSFSGLHPDRSRLQPAQQPQHLRESGYAHGSAQDRIARTEERRLAFNTCGWSTADPGAGYAYTPALGQAIHLGQFDLEPWHGQPAAGRNVGPNDWKAVVTPVPSGRAVLRVTMRGQIEGLTGGNANLGQIFQWGAIARSCMLGLCMASWNSWPQDFRTPRWARGPAPLGNPQAAYWQKRWGPELVSQIVSSGAAEVDLRRFAGGARFFSAWLLGWHARTRFDGVTQPTLAIDWQVVEDDPRDDRDHLPDTICHPANEMLATAFPAPWGAGATFLLEHVVATTGIRRGQAPSLISAHNGCAGAIDFLVELCRGPAVSYVGPVNVAAGASAILTNLVCADALTRINVYAANAPISSAATITFAGR